MTPTTAQVEYVYVKDSFSIVSNLYDTSHQLTEGFNNKKTVIYTNLFQFDCGISNSA